MTKTIHEACASANGDGRRPAACRSRRAPAATFVESRPYLSRAPRPAAPAPCARCILRARRRSPAPVALGLDRPVQARPGPDGGLYVAEQTGRILEYPSSRVVLDIADRVSCCDNGGLLSFVFHPRTSELFVLYVDRNGDTAVARDSGHVMLVVPQPKDNLPNHHGGTLQFGPDGYLYISIGDGGANTEVTRRAQDLGTLLGKLLRIDVDAATPYAIPPDNPFVGIAGAHPEIWALGLRNPWRFTFDRDANTLVLGDVGQHAWEEVNVLPLALSRAANFGWPMMEGTHCFPPETSCSSVGLTLPAIEYPTANGCSVTAGYRYRGSRLGRARDAYLFGDWCSGEIRAATERDGAWTTTTLLDSPLAVVSIDEGENGEPYIVDYRGGVYVLMPPLIRRRAARH
ncbi:MAG TPA: PQQ-dependent sugar dehydrogenase [Thermoanaerobaculia bacterium]|nr:PQQ-dependent sugar dehydrogenase [Thermoanaerobaculia bacterium]